MQLIPNQLKKHSLEYIALGIAFLAAIVVFIFTVDPYIKRRIIYSLTCFYFLWSILHHHRRGDLHLSIVMEYLVMGLIAIVFTSFTLF